MYLTEQVPPNSSETGKINDRSNEESMIEMPLKPLHLFFTLATIAVASLVPSQVRAEGNCPPGFYPIGGGSAGWVGCAPMDGGVGSGQAAPANNAPPPMINNGVRLPGLSTYDPQKWADFFEHLRQSSLRDQRESIVKRNGEAAGKTFDDLAEGVWTVGRSPKGQSTLTCAATFWTLNGGVMLMDWKGEQSGTAMMFFARSMPPEKKAKRMRVSLVQSGETQTVEVLASRFPLVPNMGMIFFKVPSSEALLGAIEDTQDFAVYLEDRKLLSGKWHSANSMRPDLAECVAQITRETSQPKGKGKP